MPRLHASWIIEQDCLWIWAQQWKSPVEHGNLHPFCLSDSELISLLETQYHLDGITDSAATFALSLPSYHPAKGKKPLPLLEFQNISPSTLEQWQVPGVLLPLAQLPKFLEQIPLGLIEESQQISQDLRFWAYIYRWCQNLIDRQKFLPALQDGWAIWYPLLDNLKDQIILAKLIARMPQVCYARGESSVEEIVCSFVRLLVDQLLRQSLKNFNYRAQRSWLQNYFKALNQRDSEIKLEIKSLQRLDNALANWRLPVEDYLLTADNLQLAYNQFHLCLILTPPKGSDYSDWSLQYGLQALDDQDFIVDAKSIWSCSAAQLSLKGRTINYPQETLLKGLAIAAKIYQPIKDSLQESLPTHCLLNPIEAYQLIKEVAWQLQDMGLGIVLPDGLSPGENEKRLGLKVQAQIKPIKGQRLNLRSLLNFDLQLSVGEHSLSRADFEKLLSQRSPLVEVKGQWIALQIADVRAAQAILDGSYEKTNLTVEYALRVALGEPAQIAKLPIVDFSASGKLENLLNHLLDNQAIESISKPEGFQGDLRPYQAKGVGWLAFLEQWGLGACLADDMGLGKTAQLIGFLLHLKANGALDLPVLIICPTSVLTNWEREIKKFAPCFETLIHHGENRAKGSNFAQSIEGYDLIITSYSLIQRDLCILEKVQWQGIVLDEAQNIKNSQSKVSLAVRKLNSVFKVALTGTPIENRLSELWSIFEFLNPGFLGTAAFFSRRFALPIEKGGDQDALNILRSLVRPFILRRLKSDKTIIVDLPDKQEMNVFCSLSSEQADLYQKLVDSSLVKIEESKGIERHGLILTLLLQLKQLCNHPALLLKEEKINKPERSGKLLRLEEMLEELILEGDRALIFTQFAQWGKLLLPYLANRLHREISFLYGGSTRQQRSEIVDRFQQDPNGPPILILSLKAGGTGLNLTRANHVFHIDRWWNPAVENQATDRAFRIGQQQNVQVHKFICLGTLEERINDILESKQQLAQQTVDAGEQWLADLDSHALRNLLLLDRDAVIDQ